VTPYKSEAQVRRVTCVDDFSSGTPTAYGNPDGETVTTTAAGIEVNACTLRWNRFGQGAVTAGPQLGHLTLTRPSTHATGYLIDGVRPC
jgi:hypothetical protein